MAKMVKISETAMKHLDNLQKMTGESKQIILEKALESYARSIFLTRTNEQYAALKKDKKAWNEMVKESQEWDVTLNDGLDKEFLEMVQSTLTEWESKGDEIAFSYLQDQ